MICDGQYTTAQLTRHAAQYVKKFYLNRFASMGKHNTTGPAPAHPGNQASSYHALS